MKKIIASVLVASCAISGTTLANASNISITNYTYRGMNAEDYLTDLRLRSYQHVVAQEFFEEFWDTVIEDQAEIKKLVQNKVESTLKAKPYYEYAGFEIVRETFTDDEYSFSILMYSVIDSAIAGPFVIPIQIAEEDTEEVETGAEVEEIEAEEEIEEVEVEEVEIEEVEIEEEIIYVEPIQPQQVEVFVNPFVDVYPSWYYVDVVTAYQNGYMSGTTDITFSPTVAASRGMLAEILKAVAGNTAYYEGTSFIDVAEDSRYASSIEWARQHNIYNGFEDGTFKPNDSITRQEFAVIMYNLANYIGKDVSARGDISTFSDVEEMTDWATPSMEWAVGVGIVGGKDGNKLDPKGTLTRAEVAAIINRFINY
ncbi:MAG: hypothetical protein ATN35_03370 [Epulopiscium sp. Nele67-Bin004]|nr:MAG: hypothetical protein ATN35_03370 [Epulopiscium sp. Nele67-Bin004]